MVQRSLSTDFREQIDKILIFQAWFQRKVGVLPQSMSWGLAAVPASSVIMGMIIVIDQSCNNGKNIWNNSVGP